MTRKWKRILGVSILLAPLAALAGAMVWEGGIIYALTQFAIAFAFMAAVAIWVGTAGSLLTDGALTVDDIRSEICDVLAELLGT